MLISVPFTEAGKIFKRRDMERSLMFMATHKTFSLRQMVNEAMIGVKSARSILNDLIWTEHLERKGRTFSITDRVGDNALVVNLRDVRSDVLFKYKAIRQVLMKMYAGETNVRTLSLHAGISYRMTKLILQKLRESGIVSGKEIRCVVEPRTPLELVPRKATRTLLQNLISMIEDLKPPEHASILYGKASWGELDPTLNILVSFKGYLSADEQGDLMQKYAIMAGNITSTFGQYVDLTFTLHEVWIAQKLGISTPKSPLLEEAYGGICFYGTEPRLEDYFQLHQLAYPKPPAKIAEWIDKGYVSEVNGKLVYTEKAIETFRKETPTPITEVSLSALGRKIRFITVGSRTAEHHYEFA